MMIKAEENEDLAADIRKNALERIMFRDEYLMTNVERARAQFISKTKTVDNLLTRALHNFTKTSDKALCEEIQKSFDITNTIFSRIVNIRAKDSNLRRGSIASPEGEQRLIGQLILKAYDLNGKIARLNDSAELTATNVREALVLLLLCFISLMVISNIYNSVSIGNLLGKRVKMISEGTTIIGAGNLGYRIAVSGDDELSILARQTNDMAAQLQNSYAALEQEIGYRESANRELEAFSYSVSHDLRTPLRAINGFSAAVIEDYADKLDDEGKRLLNVINDNAKKMGHLIDDLLAFSRIGRQELKKQEIDMHVLFNSAAQNFIYTVSERVFHLDIKPMLAAIGDPVLITQVIINLLSNAIKFSEPKDSIDIEIGCSPEEHENIYYVKDHGVGFDMQFADNLFGVFQRLHSQDQFEGTGVGLALSQRIIHRHGGRMWAEGIVNEGAIFYFTLPKSRNAE